MGLSCFVFIKNYFLVKSDPVREVNIDFGCDSTEKSIRFSKSSYHRASK